MHNHIFSKSLVIAVCLLTGLCHAEKSKQHIHIASGEWPPLISQQLPNGGEITHIITQAFLRQGITVNYSYFPWARSLALTQSGQFDATPGWFYNEERNKQFYFSEPVLKASETLIILKSAPWTITRYQDLQNKTIAGMRGYSYGDTFDQSEAEGFFTVIRNKDYDQNLRMLLSGRVDLVIGQQAVIDQEVKKLLSPNEIQQLRFIPSVLPQRDLFLLFSKSSNKAQYYLEQFNLGLKKYQTEHGQ